MKPEDYQSVFETLDLDESTLEMGHGATISPQRSAPIAGNPMKALPAFRIEEERAEDADYHIVDTLGVGGMGVVSLAEQVALRRMVAVKEPKENNERAHNRVLEEAFILGRMEHPNVVPAYGLGLRGSGAPVLVMKRVEGTSWEDVLSGAKPAPAEATADLPWNLRVLLQVCNALRFAHARLVVHRDIKPENVMIGEFGEVYLLDWGIALSLRTDEPPGVPTSQNSGGLAGTPAFMAPEMTDDDATEIDERTDVYLLGATLHQLLTGAPPHAGKSLFEVCLSAFQSEPHDYDESVPSELTVIAHRSMSREKADRYQTVAEFAGAVEGYLGHRASYTLSDAARQLLERSADTDASHEGTNRLQEAEFGFRQALTIWDGNEAAQRGLQASIEQRLRSCLAREELGGARAALAQLPERNEELAALVDELKRELDSRAERVDYLEAFEVELDLKTGTRSRQRAVLVLGFAFAIICFYQAWEVRPGEPSFTPAERLWRFWRLALAGSIGSALFWKRLTGNLGNRRLFAMFVSALAGMFFARVAAYYLDPPVAYIQITEMLVIAMALFAIGVASSRKLAIVSGVYAVAIVVGAVSQLQWVMLVSLGCAHIVFSSYASWVWRPSLTRQS